MVSIDPHGLAIRLTLLPLFVSVSVAQQETPVEIIAAQIREQGYSCDRAVECETGREAFKA